MSDDATSPPDGTEHFTAGWWEWRGGVNARLEAQDQVNREFRDALGRMSEVTQDTNDKVTALVTTIQERDRLAVQAVAHTERVEDRRSNRRVAVRVAIYSAVITGACSLTAGITALIRH